MKKIRIAISKAANVGLPLVHGKNHVLSRKFFLKGKTIGISIAETDNLSELGYGIAHFKDAMNEAARYILASGGKVAYGGDMRNGGFTELMFDLLAYYPADKRLKSNERFHSFLAWPLSLSLSKGQQAELKQNVTFHKIEPPKDVKISNPNKYLVPDSPENLYIWSRCLTKMRETMESKCNARIFIGGRTKGFKSKCPGILEEFLIAVDHKHPIYLVGSFGGMTKEIIDAFSSKTVKSFSTAYYLDDAKYKGFLKLYNSKHVTDNIDYSKYLSMIQSVNYSGLSKLNGLTIEENKRLSVTPHISEAIYLIMKGLTNCFAA